ncbi:MAG: TauD/TfdA family dioxygenase [Bdellovibrionales bacterium]|nr:TauD/TfdA family dioxygenase [Bdellovibrionales bacterium]
MPINTALLEQIRTNLDQDGLIFLENQDIATFESISSLLGHVILKTDVKIKSDATAMVQTAEPLEWHQDSPEAKWLAWFCINPGEPTETFDGRILFNLLSPVEIEILKSIKTTIRTSDDCEEETTMVSGSSNGELILYFCPWLIDDKLNELQKQTIEEVKRLLRLNDGLKNIFFWKQNDLLIIENRRMLHRRPLLDPKSDRFLMRNWIKSE